MPDFCRCASCQTNVAIGDSSYIRHRNGAPHVFNAANYEGEGQARPTEGYAIQVCDICRARNRTECSSCRQPMYAGGGYNNSEPGDHELRPVYNCRECHNELFATCCNCNRSHRLRPDQGSPLDEEGYCPRCCNADWGSAFVPDSRIDLTQTKRKYGVELETSIVPGNFKQLVRGTPFRTVHDGSIMGKEFVSRPMSGDAGLDHIDTLCNRLVGCKTDATCGYHLHIDTYDLSKLQQWNVVMGYRLTQKTWFSLVPRTRLNSTYCSKMGLGPTTIMRYSNGGRGVNEFVGTRDCDYRYKWFNVMAFNKHRTFEVRLHSGTMNAEKINNWIIAHLRFWGYLIAMPDPRAVYTEFYRKSTFRKLCRIWNCDRLTQYYTARRAQFATEPELMET